MPCTSDRPSPVPTPTLLVVKNGSKMRSITFGSIPTPVSAIRSRTYSPRGRLPVVTSRALVQYDHIGRDRDAADAFDGLHGVGAQVHHHLVQLRRVAEHRGVAGRKRTLERHAAGSEPSTISSTSETTDCTWTWTRSPMPLRLKARMRSTSAFARIPALIAASM